MDLLHRFIDLFVHLDSHLAEIIAASGAWTYLILFLIVFCETGLVVTPFLPGDSLLFAAGTFAATGDLAPAPLVLLLTAAAVLGDAVNYAVGAAIGPRVFHRDDSRFLNKDHLERTRSFYERHGAKTIIIARFLPIIRTFAPFVAGIGQMPYGRFALYNVLGGALWVSLFTFGGLFFGNLPVVRDNFTLVILAIVVLSVLPPLIEALRHRVKRRRARSQISVEG